MTLYHCSIEWFEVYACTSTPRDLPSSPLKHLFDLLVVKSSWHTKGFPVGKVNFFHMYPLSFFEFLAALGDEKICQFLEESPMIAPIPSPLHETLIQRLKCYFFVGGMPEAVAEYAKSERLNIVRETQLEILEAYERDFAKHAPPNEVMKITTVWRQVHRQLAKENKKFILSAIRKSARGRDYEEPIEWLSNAGLIHKSTLVKSPKFPLSLQNSREPLQRTTWRKNSLQPNTKNPIIGRAEGWQKLTF